MGIADELQKLEQLRAKGSLTGDEFAMAKAQLLANPPRPADTQATSVLQAQVAELHQQNELIRIDREWDIERQQYQIVRRNGRIMTPTIRMGLAMIARAVISGVFLFVVAYQAIRLANTDVLDGNLSAIFQSAIPWLAVLFSVVAIFILIALGRGFYCCVKAHNHNVAQQAYRDRRANVLSVRPAQEPPPPID